MADESQERRVRRADDAATALTHKLTRVREEAALDAVVLASEEGLMLAQAGNGDLCEWLAALAPLMSRDGGSDSLRAEFQAARSAVQPVTVDGHALFLAWSGDTPGIEWLDAADTSVRRILAAPPG